MQARSPETFLNVLKSKDFPVEAKYKAIFELKSLENQDYLIECEKQFKKKKTMKKFLSMFNSSVSQKIYFFLLKLFIFNLFFN